MRKITVNAERAEKFSISFERIHFNYYELYIGFLKFGIVYNEYHLYIE